MQTKRREAENDVSRLFIGIRPDKRTQQFLDALVSHCKQQLGSGRRDRVRWTSHANRHLTLAFLGETTGSQIAQIEKKLAQIATILPPCNGRIVSLNPFPQRRSPLLAAELLTNPALDRLHDHCRRLMADLGMKPESAAYRPHITLARSKRGFAGVEPVMLDHTVAIHSVVLYQSLAAPGGSQYLPLFETGLSGEHK